MTIAPGPLRQLLATTGHRRTHLWDLSIQVTLWHWAAVVVALGLARLMLALWLEDHRERRNRQGGRWKH